MKKSDLISLKIFPKPLILFSAKKKLIHQVSDLNFDQFMILDSQHLDGSQRLHTRRRIVALLYRKIRNQMLEGDLE